MYKNNIQHVTNIYIFLVYALFILKIPAFAIPAVAQQCYLSYDIYKISIHDIL